MLRLIIHGFTHHRRFFLLFIFFKYVLTINSLILQQHLAAQVHLPSFWNRLAHSLLWNRVNSIVQPLNLMYVIYLTAVINLGDPCKRALTEFPWWGGE
jgi:hypothetical protein